MKNLRVSSIDGLRGWAAIAVILFHSVTAMDPRFVPDLYNKSALDISGTYNLFAKAVLTLLSGESAVILFFIISGYVLSRSLESSLSKMSSSTAAMDFIFKRLLRLYPPVIVCVGFLAASFFLLSIYAPNIFQPFSKEDTISNLLLITSKVHGATWTLSAEVFAIPFFLLFGTLAFYVGRGWGAALFVIAAVAIHFCSRHTLYFDKLFLLIYFSAGFLVNSDFAERFGKLKYPAITLAAFIVSQRVFLQSKSLPGIFLSSAFGSILISQLVYGSPSRLKTLLDCRLSQFFGRLSYSIYLWNVVFLEIFWHQKWVLFPGYSSYPISLGLLVGAIALCLTIGVSYYSEKYIERPSIYLGRLITRHAAASLVMTNMPETAQADLTSPAATTSP
jgi:peptidoglycan/LPS O-acetylase OafA/YrhL